MELTCLGLGKGHGDFAGPSCHLLQVAGLHLLLECPLDMSMLLYFCPASTPILSFCEMLQKRRRLSHDFMRDRARQQKLTSLAPCTESMPLKHVAPSAIDDVSTVYCETSDDFTSSGHTRIFDGHYLLDEEPWYKTAEFDLVDLSSIDAVLISNPEGMLGLPFLMRKKDFSAKIYATAVTAKLGQLMMEELVYVHGEYVQWFGKSECSSFPNFLESSIFHTAPLMQKEFFIDDDAPRPNWHKLYGKQDIESCIKKVQVLHYDEEKNINDCVCIKPCSSGFEIGASNWVISGTRHLSYFSASDLISRHAMGLNIAPHIHSDALLFCDLKSDSGDQTLIPGVQTNSDNIKFSGNAILSSGHEKLKNQENDSENASKLMHLESADQMSAICEAATDTIASGGSVLVAISGIGALLELIEVISDALTTSNMGHIPIFFVSSVGEEILVYSNTVPEWLCNERQEKLYAGKALFGHVDLLQQKRLSQLHSIHSVETLRSWKEPCVVFTMAWTLRMGAVVHLLYKWRLDARCLLVLTQVALQNVELLLIPFRPIRMKILLYNKSQKLGLAEVAAIIEKLKPEISLLPDPMKDQFTIFSNGNPIYPDRKIGFYKTWDVLTIPSPQKIEVNMCAELACDFKPKQLDSGAALGRMMMKSKNKDAKRWLDVPGIFEISQYRLSLSSGGDICWGTMEIKDLIEALEERGLHCELGNGHDDLDASSKCAQCLVITSPSHACIQLMKNSTLIETCDPIVRQLVVDAMKNLLNFV